MQLSFTKISKLSTNDIPIPIIKELKFGTIKELDDTPVFNYTEYLRGIDRLPEKDKMGMGMLETLMSDFTVVFEPIIKLYQLPTNKIIFTDGDNIFIHNVLAIPVATYYNPSMMSEAFDALRDIYVSGFSLSDSVLYQQCMQNISNEMLIQMLKERGVMK